MKKIISVFVCIFMGAVAFAQTADEIINKYADAIGGREKIQGIKNLYMEGTVDAQGQQIVIKIWRVNKKAMRSEFTINGMTIYSIITNDSGWSFNPLAGQKTAEPMTADQVKTAQPDLDIAEVLLNYKEKGYKVAYKGKDDVDGTDAFKLEVTISDSNIETYFIDPTSYYILREKSKTISNGKTDEGQQDFSNYQKTADGYVFPMAVGSEQGAAKFTVVKINTDFDPALFKPSPAKQ